MPWVRHLLAASDLRHVLYQWEDLALEAREVDELAVLPKGGSSTGGGDRSRRLQSRFKSCRSARGDQHVDREELGRSSFGRRSRGEPGADRRRVLARLG